MRPLINLNEIDLIRGLRQGDMQSFDELYHRYLPNLLGFANSYLMDSQEAEETVQEIFIKIWEKRKYLDENKNFKSYLFQSVKNLLLNKIRNQKKIYSLDGIPLDKEVYDENVLDDLNYKDVTKKIFFLIKSLPQVRQQVFVMSRMDGLCNAEIADKLNLSKRTIENHIYLATKFLKVKLLNKASVCPPFIILFF